LTWILSIAAVAEPVQLQLVCAACWLTCAVLLVASVGRWIANQLPDVHKNGSRNNIIYLLSAWQVGHIHDSFIMFFVLTCHHHVCLHDTLHQGKQARSCSGV
jgi:hypothetical protein